MDEKDRKILEILRENSRLSSKEISRKTGIPITTVHHRVKKLESSGIISKFTVELDSRKMGKPVGAFILAAVDYRTLRKDNLEQYEILKTLKAVNFVVEADMVTGTTDIVIKVQCTSIEELNKFVTVYLRNLAGVDRTETLVILNT